MSVIKKKPYIEVLVERLTSTQIASCVSAIDSQTPETVKSLYDPNYAFSVVDATHLQDIATYRVHLDAQKVRNGLCIRVWKSSRLYENLLVYGESQKITIYELDTANRSYKLIEEYCDINELRRILFHHGGGEIIASSLHIYGNGTVDGNLTINSQLELGSSGTVGSVLKSKFSSKKYLHRVQYSYGSDSLYINFLSPTSEQITSYGALFAVVMSDGMLLTENLYGINCVAYKGSDTYYQYLTASDAGGLMSARLVSIQNGVAPILLNAGATVVDYVVED